MHKPERFSPALRACSIAKRACPSASNIAQTRESLDAAARAAIDPGKFVWVVVGDATVVEPQLEQLGLPVERIEMEATE